MWALTVITDRLSFLKSSLMSRTSDSSGKPRWIKLLGGVLFLISLGGFFYFLTTPNSYPKNVSVSNVSSQSITLSWTTATPMETKVLLSEAGNLQILPVFFYSSIGDDRDKTGDLVRTRNVHYVTLKDLKPNTRYVARIYSGLRQVYEKKLTTGPAIVLNEPNLVYGKVLGEKSAPVANALVYLRMISKEGSSSALLSAMTNEQGKWSIEASNARIRNLKKGFNPLGVKYEMMIVDDGRGKRFKATTTPKFDKPWPNIVLQASGSAEVKE